MRQARSLAAQGAGYLPASISSRWSWMESRPITRGSFSCAEGLNHLNELDRRPRFRTILILSCASFAVFAVEQVMSGFRKELFGLDPRSAGHNFSYNFMIGFPVFLLASTLSGIALFKYRSTSAAVRALGGSLTDFERLTVVPALLPILCIGYFVVRVLIVLIDR
jgi:uncharacterized membrane protein (DUF485 family)